MSTLAQVVLGIRLGLLPVAANSTLRFRASGPLELRGVLRIGYQVASGISVAHHQQRLIYWNVKPSNILLQNGVQRVKITDFGLAVTADDVGMDRASEVTGTQYMSPDQAQCLSSDPRSDLFSMGSVLYAMCNWSGTISGEFVCGSTAQGL